jgi:hypothetical protein
MSKINPLLSLWNEDDVDAFSNESFQHLLMEQYKLYVEMTDRISSRRNWTNIFFLTLHAIIVGVMGLSLSRSPYVPQIGLLLMPLMGLLVLCYAWWRLTQWYRHMLTVRHNIIGQLEQRLPSSPSLAADRNDITSKEGYFNPLNRMEKTLPFVFAILYIFSFTYVTYISS